GVEADQLAGQMEADHLLVALLAQGDALQGALPRDVEAVRWLAQVEQRLARPQAAMPLRLRRQPGQAGHRGLARPGALAQPARQQSVASVRLRAVDGGGTGHVGRPRWSAARWRRNPDDGKTRP